MKNLRLFRDYRNIKTKLTKTSVAIGNFDGMHLGHQGLIKQAKLYAEKSKTKLIIFTFYPHPLKLLRPSKAPKKIIRLRSKLKKMQALGVNIVLAQKFNEAFSKITAEDFVNKILLEHLKAINIIVGEDFHFGYNREGNVEYLKAGILKKRAQLKIIGSIEGNLGRYSSTVVRNLISEGKIKQVKEHLGSYYEVEGIVVKGKQLGRKLGFPTANINYLDCLPPKDGIYAGLVFLGENYYKAALSTGTRPHFNGEKRFLEVHILKFDKILYGKRLKIYFIDRIRDELIFKDDKTLKTQILRDCEEVEDRLRKSIEIE